MRDPQISNATEDRTLNTKLFKVRPGLGINNVFVFFMNKK